MKKSRFVSLSLAWMIGILPLCNKESEEIVAYDSWEDCSNAHSAEQCQELPAGTGDWSGVDATTQATDGTVRHSTRPHFFFFPSGGGFYNGRRYNNFSQFRSSPPTFSRPPISSGSFTSTKSSSSTSSGTKSSSSSVSRGGFGSSGSSSTS